MRSHLNSFVNAIPIPAAILLEDRTIIVNQVVNKQLMLNKTEWNLKELVALYSGTSPAVFEGIRQLLHDDIEPIHPIPYAHIDSDGQKISGLIYAKRISDIDGLRAYLITLVPNESIEPSQQSLLVEQNYIYQFVIDLLKEKINLRENLQSLLEQSQRLIPYTSASIALVDDTGNFQIIAQSGQLEGMDLSIIRIDNQGILSVNQHRTNHFNPLIFTDVKTLPDWITFEGTEYIRSWMRAPLWYQNKLIGVINFDHAEVGFFTDSHASIAEIIAKNASVAIGHAQLYEKAQTEIVAREQIQDVLINNIVTTESLYWALDTLFSAEKIEDCINDIIEMLSMALGSTQLMIIVFDPVTGKLIPQLKITEPIANSWYVFKNAVYLPTLPDNLMPPHNLTWEHGSSRTLPDGRFCAGGIICGRGALIAVRDVDAPPFTEAQQELLATISNQITLALDNEKLYRDLEERTHQLDQAVQFRTKRLDFERKRFESILNATAEGIFYIKNQRFEYGNPTFYKMIGYQLADLYGKSFDVIQSNNGSSEQVDFQVLLNQGITEGKREVRLRHQDGSEFYASIHYASIQDQDSTQVVGIVRDISQERELYFQQARFITNAAHELRTPLSTLIVRLHLLRRQPDQLEDHLNKLDKIGDYLRKLVEDLLTLSRFDNQTLVLEREECNLEELIIEAYDTYIPFAESEKVSIELNLPKRPVVAHVDRTWILRMIGNLIANAINYNKHDGKVWVNLMEDHDHELKRPAAIIEVIDNGIGIERDLLPTQIFEPFVRPSQGTRKETGMGLALVRQIVHLHRGRIYVASEGNKGSTFTVILPLS